MQLTQKDRTLSITTPLGEDVLLLRSMTGSEQLGRLFEYQLSLLSEDFEIRYEDLLGKSLTVNMQLLDGSERHFNGIVNRFAQVGFDGGLAQYDATVVPSTWFLTRTSDCRIFQEKTVPDIIKEVLRENDITDFEERLNGSYRKWVYCVQYRETDFNFISRLMEQEGIYYFFTHEQDKHKLVFADDYSSHAKVPGYEEVPYYPPGSQALRERDHITEWILQTEVQPGCFAHTDFDFTAPKKALLAKLEAPKPHEQAKFEIYDYPGEYCESGDGDSYARIRLEEMQADYQIAQAEGNARGLTCGALFNLTEFPREDQNREYLITGADYQLQSDRFMSMAGAGSGPVFACSVTAMDAKTPFRPARTAPKPMVQGPQTAIVTGKSGEEIWTNEYGCVKVQFHWDRYGKNDENSSCWVRCSHPWAGKNWGAVAIPRIGQEVIVEFLEGDPDQPIITGRVYNGDSMPPYGLPASAVISGLKSDSTKGGGGYNEYVMDDTKGNELIREHGQFDKDSTIENDLREHVLNDRSRDVTNNETVLVGNDRAKTIGHDETTKVGNDRTEAVGANETIAIGVNRKESVGSNETITIGANRTEQVGKNETITIGVNRTEKVGADESIAIGKARTEQVGKSESVQVGDDRSHQIGKNGGLKGGKDQSVSVGDNRTVSVGKNDALKVGKNLTIDAGDSVTIKTGKASISMKKDGTITIQGKDITIKGSGGINVKASKNVVIKGQKVLEN